MKVYGELMEVREVILDPTVVDASVGEALEEHAVAKNQLDEYVNKEFLNIFDSYKKFSAYLVGAQVLSRFGVVKQLRKDDSTKRRWVSDVKQLSAKHSTKRWVPSPRGVDVAYEATIVWRISVYEGDAATSVTVLNFVDAFWNVPLAPRERQCFCGKMSWEVLLLLSGSARLAARAFGMGWRHLVGDAAQSVFWESGKGRMRINTQVDIDVWQPDLHTVCVFCIDLAVSWTGFFLPFERGALVTSVVWIGFKITSYASHVDLGIGEECVSELRRLTAEAMKKNVTAQASVLVFWRPFLSELCAACIWRRPIMQTGLLSCRCAQTALHRCSCCPR